MQLLTRPSFAVVFGLAVVSSASHVVAERGTTTTVTRLYTGPDGQSHAVDTDVVWRPAKLRAELSDSESVKVTGAQFLRWPRGFVWAGHPASKRQYIVIVSGRGEVDVAGGPRVQLTPGRVLLAEDITGKGHTTRVGADEDLVMLLVPLAEESRVATVSAQPREFDAASIVQSVPGGSNSFRVTPSGIFYTNATLEDCIQAAYQVSRFEVSGPESLGRRRFDITARTAGPATKEQLMLMLQALLADRFAVRLHREVREMRALALTVSRGGTKLTAGEPSGRADVIAMSNGTDLKNHTMPQLAHYLSRLPIGLPVVDKTGLDGRYNVHIDLAQLAAGKKPDAAVGRDGSPIDPPSTISNDALRPYGLELQSRKLPVDVIVIDAARIDPTPN